MGHRHDEAEDEQIPFWLDGAEGSGHHIVVTSAKRQWLDEHLARQWRRSPTAEESARFVADFVREEVLYREALARGLDRNDLVVRRRLVQKMEMLALQDGAGIGDAELIDHYLEHRAEYALPESISFRHLFFSTTLRGADAPAAAEAALTDVRGREMALATRLGDTTPTPTEVVDWTRPMVEGRFGTDFTASVFELEPGAWTGPVASAYGFHLVLVSRHSPARVRDFAEVAERIATDLDTARRSGALDRIYASVRDAYEVDVEPATAEGLARDTHAHDHDGSHHEQERTRA